MAVLVFDFDGTLVDSNGVKRDAYHDAVRDVPGAPAALDRFFAAGGRGDRFTTMARVAEALGRPELAGEFAGRYTRIVREAILVRLADGWARKFLAELAARAHAVHVSSATPADELQAILAAAGLADRLRGSRGGFEMKVENLRAILAAESASGALVVGDGDDDDRSAAACGCAFARVDDGPSALFRRSPVAAADWVEARIPQKFLQPVGTR